MRVTSNKSGKPKKVKSLIKKIELKSGKAGLYLCGGGSYCNEPKK